MANKYASKFGLMLILMLLLPHISSVAMADQQGGYTVTRRVLMELVIAGQTSVANYHVYEKQAREENLPHIADLFRAMATSQKIMTRNFEKLLKELGQRISPCAVPSPREWNTRKNLMVALREEIHETDTLYPDAMERIRGERHPQGMAILKHALRAQQMHRDNMEEIYDAARSYYSLLKSELKRREPTYYICHQSGAMLLDALPKICPVRGESTVSYQELHAMTSINAVPIYTPAESQRRL